MSTAYNIIAIKLTEVGSINVIIVVHKEEKEFYLPIFQKILHGIQIAEKKQYDPSSKNRIRPDSWIVNIIKNAISRTLGWVFISIVIFAISITIMGIQWIIKKAGR